MSVEKQLTLSIKCGKTIKEEVMINYVPLVSRSISCSHDRHSPFLFTFPSFKSWRLYSIAMHWNISSHNTSTWISTVKSVLPQVGTEVIYGFHFTDFHETHNYSMEFFVSDDTVVLCGNKMPTRWNRGFYCSSYCLLNMLAEVYVFGLQDAAVSCKPNT